MPWVPANSDGTTPAYWIITTTNGNTTNAVTWTRHDYVAYAAGSLAQQMGVQPYTFTPAQIAEAAANSARIMALFEAQQIERRRAIARADVLLQESLSPQQRAELGDRGTFMVATHDAAGAPRFFRIMRGRVANIIETTLSGAPIARWCVHPRLDVPDADTMLAQKLWLEHSPDTLLAIANRHPV